MCICSFIALALVKHFTIWEVEVCELGECRPIIVG